MGKDLSVIIVSYNTKDLLRKCLIALAEASRELSTQITVVDNASRDESPQMVRSLFPEVEVLENTENLGFSKASNQGLRIAKGDFVLLLNSDAIVSESSMGEMMDYMKRNPKIGVLGPKIYNTDGSVQEVARTFPQPIHFLFGRRSPLTKLFPNASFVRRYLIMRERDKGEPFEVDWVSGACMMIRSEVVKEVGLLDEAFFMYWEDADYCKRVKVSGWKVHCLPTARVVHDEGSSSGPANKKLIWVFHQSVFQYYLKHHTRRVLHPLTLIAWLLLVTRAVGIILYKQTRESIRTLRASC